MTTSRCLEEQQVWKCQHCTFNNDWCIKQCEMCGHSSPQWQCFQCTFMNDPTVDLCVACGTSKCSTGYDEKSHCDEGWQCLHCTYSSNVMTANECAMCGRARLSDESDEVWQCVHCSALNALSHKKCNICDGFDETKYWQCPKCTVLNDKTCASVHCSVCSSPPQVPTTSASPHGAHASASVESNNQQMVPFVDRRPPPIFIDFRDDEHKNRVIEVTLSKDNALQRQHFDTFAQIVTELNASWLCINTSFLERHLDSNNCAVAVTFIDVTQEFAQYLRRNNEQILQEIKRAIECQSYQPKELSGADDLQVIPVWHHLNECVLGMFEMANEFLELRDEFILALMNIMWSGTHQLDAKKAVIEKLKENIKRVNTTDDTTTAVIDRESARCDSKILQSLNKLLEILPGQQHFRSVLDELPAQADKVNSHVQTLNKKYAECEETLQQRRQLIEAKKTQLSNKKCMIDQETSRFEQAKRGNSVQLANTYCDSVNAMVLSHNELVHVIDEDVRQLNQFKDNFVNSVKPFEDEISGERKEHERLMANLNAARDKTGITGDNLIGEFLGKANDLIPLSVRICSRIVTFETLISTLSELLVRITDDSSDEKEECPTIEWFFNQPQIGLKEFVEPLHSKGIKNIRDLELAYKGKPELFENELIPYLKQKLNRRIKLGEKRRLKRLCQANEE